MKKINYFTKSKMLLSIAVVFVMAFSIISIIGFIDSAKADGPDELCISCVTDINGVISCYSYPCDDDPLAKEYFVDDDDDGFNAPPVIDIPCSQTDRIRFYSGVPFIDIDLSKCVSDPDDSFDSLTFSYATTIAGYSSDYNYFDVTIGADDWLRIEPNVNPPMLWDYIEITVTDPHGASDSQVIQMVVHYDDGPASQGPTTYDATNIVGTTATISGRRTDNAADVEFMMDNDCDWWVDINAGDWDEEITGMGPAPATHHTNLTGLTLGKIYFYRFSQTVWNGSIGDIQPGKMKWFIAGQSSNSDPVANDDLANVDEDSSNNQIDVLNNDNDPDVGDTLSISSVGSASQGSTSQDGSFVYYTPNPGCYGSDSFSYSISDGNGGTATATVDITINQDIDIPEKPTIEGGIQTCYTGISYNFESVLSGIGPNAKYYFDWDDGEEIPDPTTWTPVTTTPLSGAYTWSKAGVYDVKVYVVMDDLVNGGTIIVCSLPSPVQVMHKSENPEDG